MVKIPFLTPAILKQDFFTFKEIAATLLILLAIYGHSKPITEEWNLKVNSTFYTQEKCTHFAARKITLCRRCMEILNVF